jgi:prevent-host-death family protein
MPGAMSSIGTSDARNNLAGLLNRVACAKERVRITRRGKVIAAVVPIEDLEMIETLEDECDVREARRALAEAATKGTIAWKDVKNELGTVGAQDSRKAAGGHPTSSHPARRQSPPSTRSRDGCTTNRLTPGTSPSSILRLGRTW